MKTHVSKFIGGECGYDPLYIARKERHESKARSCYCVSERTRNCAAKEKGNARFLKLSESCLRITRWQFRAAYGPRFSIHYVKIENPPRSIENWRDSTFPRGHCNLHLFDLREIV